MKFSEILDKPLLSLSEGSVPGRVRGCVLNADKTRLLALDTGDGWVPAKDFRIGESAVLIRSSAAVSSELPAGAAMSPLFLDLFGSDGSLAGPITDLVFDDRLTLTHFVAGGAEIPRSLMLSAGDNAVVVCPDEETLRRERRKISAARKKEQTAVLSDVEKVSSTFTYLIGRRVAADIYNQRGEKIVRKNSVVSLHTLQICREFGKLLILAKNSRQS